MAFSLKAQIGDNFENFNYNKVCLSVNHFVSNQLSAFYFHLIKDRLYCDAETTLQRRSAVTTLWHILNVFRYFNKFQTYYFCNIFYAINFTFRLKKFYDSSFFTTINKDCFNNNNTFFAICRFKKWF